MAKRKKKLAKKKGANQAKRAGAKKRSAKAVRSSKAKRKATRASGKVNPEILIFDVDGVLVDVRETYWRSGLQTMEKLTGRKVNWAEFHEWKRKPGNNDDWQMVSQWATALGVPTTYEEAREAFQPFYWGSDGQPGNVLKEKLVITPQLIRKWAAKRELDLFTGRTRQEFTYTFEKWAARDSFRVVITMDDAPKKPHPEGLLRILNGRDSKKALYIGDNIDDALAAKAAGVPFMAILSKREIDYREKAKKFRELGALRLLEKAKDLERWLA